MLCFTLDNCSLYTLKPKNSGKHSKECSFMNASLNLGNQQIENEGVKTNIPLIVINNDDYDEDQD
jgi:hypothetical protein